MRHLIYCILIFLLTSTVVYAQDADTDDESAKPDDDLSSFEMEFDPYYSTAGYFLSLTDKPIETVEVDNETAIYGKLLRGSYAPRFLVLEGSINPMPLLGVWMKENARSTYDGGEIKENLNLWKAVTAGFEEPWAVSLFLGNVVNLVRPGEEYATGNKGYIGYLFSGGMQHIKNNELIDDNWYEFEWKVKGDREDQDNKLSWSFRLGGKWHQHPEIADSYYVAMRRSSVDFLNPKSFLRNSAVEYKYYMDTKSLRPIQHNFYIEKKFPVKRWHKVFSLAIGFIIDKGLKYSGDLGEDQPEEFQLILRPNIEF
jgi:hypothetical protein